MLHVSFSHLVDRTIVFNNTPSVLFSLWTNIEHKLPCVLKTSY